MYLNNVFPEKCSTCPYCEYQRDPDEHDWTERDNVKIYCELQRKVIVTSMRPKDADDFIPPSSKCVLKYHEEYLTKKNKELA